MEETYYQCRTCQENKTRDEFHTDNNCRMLDCKKCKNKKQSERARSKRSENPEKFKQRGREYYQKNKERRRQAKYEWAKRNQDKVKLTIKKYYLKNKDKLKEKGKEFLAKNPHYKKEADRRYREKKIRNDPLFGLTDRIRHSIRRLLEKKESRSLQYVGCDSINEFYLKLSSKTKNLNWIQDGYQIDHIWQVHWFSEFIERSNKEDVERLMYLIHHHENLRPLEKMQNNLRSYFDIMSINLDLYPKFKPFLNEKIARMIEHCISNHLEFDSGLLPRGGQEEAEFIAMFDDKLLI